MTETPYDPIRNMLFMLLLNDIKKTIIEDPQKAILKIDNHLKGLKEIFADVSEHKKELEKTNGQEG